MITAQCKILLSIWGSKEFVGNETVDDQLLWYIFYWTPWQRKKRTKIKKNIQWKILYCLILYLGTNPQVSQKWCVLFFSLVCYECSNLNFFRLFDILILSLSEMMLIIYFMTRYLQISYTWLIIWCRTLKISIFVVEIDLGSVCFNAEYFP